MTYTTVIKQYKGKTINTITNGIHTHTFLNINDIHNMNKIYNAIT